MEFTAKIDRNLKSNFTGYGLLLKHFTDIDNCEQPPDKVIFDFSENENFDLNLFAVLTAIRKNRNDIPFYLSNINQDLKQKLMEHNFPDIEYNLNDKSKTNIGYKIFTPEPGEIDKFYNYITTEIIEFSKMPKMTKAVKIKIKETLGEVFGNVGVHSNSKFITCCGQIKMSTKRLDFTIVNLGTTIKENVVAYSKVKKEECGTHAISWAVQPGNSTKMNSIGGFGLAFLCEFVQKNKGKLQIVSDNEFWELNKDKKSTKIFKNTKFPGTIVNIEFNISDNGRYSLKRELKEEDLF